MDHEDQLDPREIQDNVAMLGHQEMTENQEHREHQDHLDYQEKQDLKDHQE